MWAAESTGELGDGGTGVGEDSTCGGAGGRYGDHSGGGERQVGGVGAGWEVVGCGGDGEGCGRACVSDKGGGW